MAVTYSTTLKNTRMDAVTTAIGASGLLVIGTTGMATTLATIPLDTTAFGAASNGVITLSGTPRSDTSADNSGTAAEAEIRTSGGTPVVTGLTVTATGNGGNIQLASTSIVQATTVSITSGTLTHG